MPTLAVANWNYNSDNFGKDSNNFWFSWKKTFNFFWYLLTGSTGRMRMVQVRMEISNLLFDFILHVF